MLAQALPSCVVGLRTQVTLPILFKLNMVLGLLEQPIDFC